MTPAGALAPYGQVVNATFTGGPADWFGAGNPMAPSAPPDAAGRRFDYPFSYNTNNRPRANEPLTFQALRDYADGWDLLRLVIETRKDQMSRLAWKLTPKDKSVKLTGALEAKAKTITEFFEQPDGENDWDGWLRLLLEDLFVIDAPTIYPQLTRGGGLASLVPMDGATIKRVIDNWGRTPAAPMVAYQQIIKGFAAINYSRDHLIYRPRNPRTNRVYGCSPVEQCVAIINLGIRRETWQLNFFRKGSMPDALIGTPNEWTPDQIRIFQEWWDARQANAAGGEHGATFVPGDIARGYVATKETELFGQAEEWLARVICFAFSLSPTSFTKMTNRATSETQKEQSEEDGLEPVKRWVSRTINYILRTYLCAPELVHVWDEEVAIDPKIQSDILDAKTKGARLTVNEARQIDGMDPYDSAKYPEADMPMVYTATGMVPLGIQDQIDQSQAKLDAFPPPPPVAPGTPGAGGSQQQPPGGGGGGGGDSGGPAPKPAAGGGGKPPPAASRAGAGGSGKVVTAISLPPRLAKAMASVSATRPKALAAHRSIKRTVAAAFVITGKSVARQVSAHLNASMATKAAGDDTQPGGGSAPHHNSGGAVSAVTVAPLSTAEIDKLLSDLDLSSLGTIVDAVDADLFDLAADTAIKALAQVGVQASQSLVDQVNERAVTFARDRAAELVGKKWTKDGELVDSTTPGMAITESTRGMLRATITEGLEENIGTPAIAKAIEESYAFSEERADLIARTEVSIANGQSKLDGWRAAEEDGVTLKKSWLVSGNESTCDVCLDNQAQGPIPLDEDFESGDDAEPAHPECMCVTIPEVEEADGQAEEEDNED